MSVWRTPLALKADPKVPLELYEARHAVQIARATGAEPVRLRNLPEGGEQPEAG